MKKHLAFVLALAVTVALAGCRGPLWSDEPSASTAAETASPQPDWGITLSVQDVTATGLTLVISQSGGSPTGRLQYGSEYYLEVLNDGVWESVPYATGETVAWTMEAYAVSMGASVEKDIRWESIYGTLSAGTYRISKGFMDFRGTGDYDERSYCAEFEIQ